MTKREWLGRSLALPVARELRILGKEPICLTHYTTWIAAQFGGHEPYAISRRAALAQMRRKEFDELLRLGRFAHLTELRHEIGV